MGKLTVKEAIEQGYEYAGIDTGDYGRLLNIADLADEFESNRIWIAEKDANYFTISGEDLKEIIADQIVNDYCDRSGNDDGDNVHKEIMDSIDVTAIRESINKVFEKHWWRMLTNIEIIP